MWYDIVDGNGDFLGHASGDTPEGAVEGVQKYWPRPEDRWLRDPNDATVKLLVPGTKSLVEFPEPHT